MEIELPTTCNQEMRSAVMRAAELMERDAIDDTLSFVVEQINPDGGFRGRDDKSDLYYSVFGADCMLALGCDIDEDRFGEYVHGFGNGEGLDFIHLCCLARCLSRLRNKIDSRLAETISARIETFRSADGGYSHVSKNAEYGTVYAAFLAMLAMEDLGRQLPEPGKVLESIDGLRTIDKSFANQRGLRGGTSSTAAALVVLSRLGVPVDPTSGDWLMARAHEQGGFKASEHAPMPDLLSTATALFALRTIRMSLDDIRNATSEFVEMLWSDNGGFCGHVAEDIADCEYTFYALLSLGCLA